MKGSYVQRGETIDYKNSTASEIAANQVVALKHRIGFAATDIPVGAIGTLNTVGVFEMAAETTNAFEIGQKVYFAGGKVVADETSGVVAGYTVADKAANSAIARVKID